MLISSCVWIYFLVVIFLKIARYNVCKKLDLGWFIGKKNPGNTELKRNLNSKFQRNEGKLK